MMRLLARGIENSSILTAHLAHPPSKKGITVTVVHLPLLRLEHDSAVTRRALARKQVPQCFSATPIAVL